MRIASLIIFTLLIGYNFGQKKEVTSFYFDQAQPTKIDRINEFDSIIIGEYFLDEDTLQELVISQDSVYSKFSMVIFLTEKELAASKDYKIKDDLLWGVKKGKGIPYAKRNDTIYSVLIQKEIIFKPTRKDELKRVGDKYFLNFKQDNGYYSTMLLEKTEDGINFAELDHDLVIDEVMKFENMKTIQLDGLKTYIANPSKTQLTTFVDNEGFKDKTLYILAN